MRQSASRKEVAEQIWLQYFNRVLLENNVITEEAYRKMESLIHQRKASSKGSSIA